LIRKKAHEDIAEHYRAAAGKPDLDIDSASVTEISPARCCSMSYESLMNRRRLLAAI
jgi:hypothetical protein